LTIEEDVIVDYLFFFELLLIQAQESKVIFVKIDIIYILAKLVYFQRTKIIILHVFGYFCWVICQNESISINNYSQHKNIEFLKV